MTLTPLRPPRALPRCVFSSTRPNILSLYHQHQRRGFHPSRRKCDDAFPNHYATLDLPSSAAPAEIKKQFYALSKKYHPDVNHDPSASERFVKISEAYHILGSAEKKGKYDRDFQRAHGHGRHHHHHHGGSYSSRSGGPAGGRPASGLSKRRSQFRGPPPSFYAQGGYGSQSSRRQQARDADEARSSQQQSRPYDPDHPDGLGSQPKYTGTGGFSPGSEAEFDPDPFMPYFDKASHKRTHENLGARQEAYTEARRPRVDAYAAAPGSGLVANFFIVAAVVAVATVAASVVLEFVRAGPASMGSGGGTRRRESRPDG